MKDTLDQLCPTRSPWTTYDPGENFMQPSLGFCCSISSLHTDNQSLFW